MKKERTLEAVRESCRRLIEQLERGADCDELLVAQREFEQAVDDAMDAYRRGEIRVDAVALPELMYEFVKTELPMLCRGDSAMRTRALQRARLFLNTMDLVVAPVEVDGEDGSERVTGEAVSH